jgi:hypothetical protein
MTFGIVGIARKSIVHRFLSIVFPFCISLVRAGAFDIVGKTGKVRSPYRSNEEAGALACGVQTVLPTCSIRDLRQAEPGPDLPASLEGATRLEYSSQPEG